MGAYILEACMDVLGLTDVWGMYRDYRCIRECTDIQRNILYILHIV